MTRKIFIDKTKEFKKPSINTNQYDFFFSFSSSSSFCFLSFTLEFWGHQ